MNLVDLANELEQLVAAQQQLANVSVKCAFNELNPLDLIDCYEAQPSARASLNTATKLLKEQKITFSAPGYEDIVVTGLNVDDFVEQPYLLHLLFKICYIHVAKKLAPPVKNSATSDGKQASA